jgi:hypothetical protein
LLAAYARSVVTIYEVPKIGAQSAVRLFQRPQSDLPDGLLDAEFSGDGWQTVNLGSLADIAYGVTIDAQGRLVLAGRKGSDMAVVRLLASGSVDTLFGDAHSR